MANENLHDASADPNAPLLTLQTVYLRDCSYESPKGPRIEGQWNPQLSMDLNTQASAVSSELREVVLTVTVSAKQSNETAFLAEVKQAGLFVMRNLSEEDQRRAIGTVCPGVLFPYARAAISSLVTQGGFPNFVLPPVNFDALYAQSLVEVQSAVKN
jgi:preprotein translocase subunit SecB